MTTDYTYGQHVLAPDHTGAIRHCRVIRGLDQCGRHQLRVIGTGRNVGGHRGGYDRVGDVLVIYARPDEMAPYGEGRTA
jgi:hypothetical protein